MKRSRQYKKILAFVCSLSLLVSSLGIQVLAGSTTPLTEVTFSDFGFESKTYDEQNTILKDLPSVTGINGIAFNGQVQFHSQGSNPVNTGIFIGGKNQWASFILTYHDAAINFYDNINGTYEHLGSVAVTTEEVADFRITFEYVGTTDVKVTCVVKDTELCNQTFAGYQESVHDHLMLVTNDTKITINSVVPQEPEETVFTDMTFSNFGFADETYNANTCTLKDLPEVVGLHSIALQGKVQFHSQGANAVNTGLFIGGKNQWASFILTYHDASINFYDNINGTYAHLGSVAATTEELVDFRITFEYVGTADVKVTCVVKGTELCNRTFVGYQESVHDHLMINTNETKITLNSVVPQEPENPEEPEQPEQPAVTYKELSFVDYGIGDGTYSPVTDKKGTATGITSLDKVAFTGYVKFEEGTNPINNSVRVGGNDTSHWFGLNMCYADAGIYLFNQLPSGGDAVLVHVSNDTLQVNPTETAIKVRLTFDYVVNSTNVNVTFSINDNKYYEGVLVGAQEELGIHMLVSATTASVTVGKVEQEKITDLTFSNYEVANGTYTNPQNVNGSANNVTTLDGTTFTGYITFGEGPEPYNNCVRIGGNDESNWYGLGVFYADAGIYLWDHLPNGTNNAIKHVTTAELDADPLTTKVKTQISFEYVGTTDVKVTFSLNDTKYYEGVLTNAQEGLGNKMLVAATTAPMTVESFVATEPDNPGGPGEPIVPEVPEKPQVTYTEYTFADFGVNDKTYSENYTNTTENPEIASIDGVAISGKVQFHKQGANPLNTGIFVGGKNQWAAFVLAYHDNAIHLYDNVQGNYEHIGSVAATTEELVDVRMTFAYADRGYVYVTCKVKETTICDQMFEGYQELMHDHVLVNTNDTTITIDSEGNDVVVPELTDVTLQDMAIRPITHKYVKDAVSASGEYRSSLLNTRLTQKITFSNHTGNRLTYGGGESVWHGIRFITNADNGEIGVDCTDAQEVYSITPKDAGITLLGEEIELTLELFESQETAGDVLLGVYLEGNLYNNTYMKFSGAANKIGKFASIYIVDENGTIKTGEEQEEPLPNIPEVTYKEYTFIDFGVPNKTYPEQYTNTTENPEIQSLDGVAISGKIRFHKQGSNPLNSAVFVGGKNQWAAFILAYHDGEIHLYDNVQGTFAHMGSVAATTEELADVRMTFAYADKGYVYVTCTVKGTEICNQMFAGYQELMHDHVLVNTNDIQITFKSKEKVIKKPKLTEVTLEDIGIQPKVYKYVSGAMSATGEYEKSLLNSKLTQKITFSNHTGNRLTYGGGESVWHGIRFITNAENGEIGVDCTDASEMYSITPKAAGMTLLGEEIDLTLELFENQEKKGDVLLGVYLNGQLYNSTYMKFSGAADKIGKFASIYITDKDGTIKTGDPGPIPTLNKKFKRITFNSYGVLSGIYGYNEGNFAIQGNCKLDTLDGVIFSDTVNFSKEPGIQLRLGGKETAWEGIVLYSMIDGMLQIMDTYNGFTPITFYPAIAGMDLTGQDIHLTMSFEYVDYDGDGKKDDVKLGVWFNGKPYDNSWLYLKDKAPELGRYMMIYSASKDSTLTVTTYTPPVDFTEFGFTVDWAIELGLKKR